jgi:hypothetical protein
MRILIAFLLLHSAALAGERVTISQFLEEVKKQSPQMQSLYINVQSLENRLKEADLATTPIGYASWQHGSDEKPNSNTAFQGSKVVGDSLLLGVKQETTIGLAADLSVDRTRWDREGVTVDPQYTDSRATLSLRQSLWKNFFGEQTRAQKDAGRAATRAELMQARYAWRTAVIQAENVYWTLASLQQVAKL